MSEKVSIPFEILTDAHPITPFVRFASPQPKRVEQTYGIPVRIRVKIQPAGEAHRIGIDEAAQIRVVVPCPHVEQSVRVGLHAVASVEKERRIVGSSAIRD